MDMDFKKKAELKVSVRKRESKLLAENKISASELGKQNFCMKGANLSDYKNSDGSFSLF